MCLTVSVFVIAASSQFTLNFKLSSDEVNSFNYLNKYAVE